MDKVPCQPISKLDKNRQFDRQIDKQVDRQIEEQLDRQIDTNRQIDRQVDRQLDRQNDRYKDRQINKRILKGHTYNGQGPLLDYDDPINVRIRQDVYKIDRQINK